MTKSIFKSIAISLLFLCPQVSLAKEEPSGMTYDLAMRAMETAEAYDRKPGWNVTILITDQNADAVMLRRLDGASISSLSFATSKALVVTQTGLTSGEYATKLKAGDIKEIAGGTTYKGGVPVYVDGKLIGSVNVSGVQDYQDEEVSIAAAKTIGSISKE